MLVLSIAVLVLVLDVTTTLARHQSMDVIRHPEKAKSTQKKRCEPPAISEEARTLLKHSITITSTVALSTSTIEKRGSQTASDQRGEGVDSTPVKSGRSRPSIASLLLPLFVVLVLSIAVLVLVLDDTTTLARHQSMDMTRHPEKAKTTQKKWCEPPATPEEARTLFQHSITSTSTTRRLLTDRQRSVRLGS